MSAPAVAVSAKHNKLVVAWKDMRAGEPNIYWSVSDATSFREGVVVHHTLKGTQDHPSATIDSAGTGWLAWEHSQNGKTGIRIRSEAEDSETVISTEPQTSFPVIASGPGTVAVAYESRQRERKEVRFRVVREQ